MEARPDEIRQRQFVGTEAGPEHFGNGRLAPGGGQLQQLQVMPVRGEIVSGAESIISLPEFHGGEKFLPVKIATKSTGFANQPGDDMAVVDLDLLAVQSGHAVDLASL